MLGRVSELCHCDSVLKALENVYGPAKHNYNAWEYKLPVTKEEMYNEQYPNGNWFSRGWYIKIYRTLADYLDNCKEYSDD